MQECQKRRAEADKKTIKRDAERTVITKAAFHYGKSTAFS